MKKEELLKNFNLSNEVREIFEQCPNFQIVDSIEKLKELSLKNSKDNFKRVKYNINEETSITEAEVCKVRNGISANFLEPYMRRRDPDCMVIADDYPTDKERYEERFGEEFEKTRQETFDWLKTQELVTFFFEAGPVNLNYPVMAIAPANAGFFAFGLALLQGIKNFDEIETEINPKGYMFVAPPFRHTHFDGKQVVVHNRLKNNYELFSYNLYPGPSAKKGVYSMLINLGEQNEWPTLHCSAVQVITPYDNKINIAYEGASGAGKSEMLQDMHRERSGRILLGKNIVTDDEYKITLPQGCSLRPIADDMAVTPSYLQKGEGKLSLKDAENAWFVRVDHIDQYGVDPHLESITCHPKGPLMFLNIDAAPNSTALIWEHIEDEPGKPCPNPRVVIPRKNVPEVIEGSVDIDVRGFGVRTPPCTKENPTYGILGLFHVLPPALAWLWRLVSPRGYGNPSINDTDGMSSEGVGSYWPFATGRKVDQANILLKQIVESPEVKYILCPNQYIGSWKVGFMPEWIAREYLARRGGAWFTKDQIEPSRLPLLGYTLKDVMVEGQMIERELLKVQNQPEVGKEAFDQGANILREFFKEYLKNYNRDELLPLGKKIIECFLSGGSLDEFISLIDYPVINEE
ncbi:MAG: DUF4914 family protein [Halanaerobiales bacterium]|nr:DUF4914 family protein [Halanaerobiales bacterium]